MGIEDKYLIENNDDLSVIISKLIIKQWSNHYNVGIRNLKTFQQTWKDEEKIKSVLLRHAKAEIEYWQSEYEKFDEME